MSLNLERFGFDNWFQKLSEDHLEEGILPARVIEVNRNQYIVSDGIREMPGELSGKFLFAIESSLDFPTVGDWVGIQIVEGDTFAIIHWLFPRKTLLKRKESGKKIEFQLIGANIDFGLVVQSATNPNSNARDRYLVMLREAGIQPVLIFTKIDLLSVPDLALFRQNVSESGVHSFLISNVSAEGVFEISNWLQKAKTYCLLGPSGVGKTSLLNQLMGDSYLEVGEVREKDQRGRHTTVRRQLICLESGSIFIDSPGMRELGNFEISEGIEATFGDFLALGKGCRFRDCTHTVEKGCAILSALERGEIDPKRYENYLKLRRETEYYESSNLQKRKKEKHLAKEIKRIKKLKDSL